MSSLESSGAEELSPWWRRGVVLILIVEFSFLIWISANTLVSAIGPPIPDQDIDQSGKTLFAGEDVRRGQGLFLKYALTDNGTIWGHGAY
jgi:nitric oxide reductase subunit B